VLGVLFAVNRGSEGLIKQRVLTAEVIADRQAQQDRNLPPSATQTSQITNDTSNLANALFRYASLPFEIASVLLLVAIIGSVMLARTLKQEASADDLAPEVLLEERANPELGGLDLNLAAAIEDSRNAENGSPS
jgi:hypothetical protein